MYKDGADAARRYSAFSGALQRCSAEETFFQGYLLAGQPGLAGPKSSCINMKAGHTALCGQAIQPDLGVRLLGSWTREPHSI